MAKRIESVAISDTISRSVLPPGAELAEPALSLTGSGESVDCFAVAELAVQTIAAASSALARYAGLNRVTVDRRLAGFWFGTSLRPLGWGLPALRDEFSGDYKTRDGWIRLHCNAKAHRQAVLTVLGQPGRRAAAELCVSEWSALALQEAVVDAGGAAAMMYPEAQWAEHPQGSMVACEPLVAWRTVGEANADPRGEPARPLAGLRVLDLTRIIAGPVATRFLAAFGASVLRIDPPGWDEVGNIPEMTPGKRCATLDLKSGEGRRALAGLIAEADVLVHGYRADALERIGFGDAERHRLNPGLIDVALNAFGWTGPWRNRRGFDSLVQMSSGIAAAGMQTAGIDKPRPLTVQALDHATGYCLAASVLNALSHRRATGEVTSARMSLAATAELLKKTRRGEFGAGFVGETESDVAPDIENTDWGQARRLRFPMRIGDLEARWDTPAVALHTSTAAFC